MYGIELSLLIQKILDFVEARMVIVESNLSAVVGTAFAANLMITPGSHTELASMTSCDVQLLGSKKIHLASKSTPAAREDSIKGDPSGNIGICIRVEVLKKIEKLLKPHPVRLPTPLPIPSDASQSKKTRVGRRLRKNRERYAMTDIRNLANKIHFGVPEESSLDGGLGAADYGMLLFLIVREDGNPMDGGASIETGLSTCRFVIARNAKETDSGIYPYIVQRRDTQEIFAQPVDPDEVVGYFDIIKEPMDFGTIRAKLQEGMYTSLDQFQVRLQI
ncbi:hypothetical protein POTOM_059745 [Populus tomentosa]|uniref:Bromo domain-containing protein n=1 Tax=Populus tomentosa TaxID=118781 RepID=A0A8X7XUN6_POPTO|nr:hypothetical protein POTOM_059745 [Populus tomentosa]